MAALSLSIFLLFFLTTRANAGDDWGWYRGNIFHPNEYVMNVENEGFVYEGCEGPSAANKSWKLQIKSGSGKKAKYKTVAIGTIVTRLDKPSLQKYNSYFVCDDPNYPYLIVFDWSPYDWQKDYKAKVLQGKSTYDTFTIIIHPALKKLKPIIQN